MDGLSRGAGVAPASPLPLERVCREPRFGNPGLTAGGRVASRTNTGEPGRLCLARYAPARPGTARALVEGAGVASAGTIGVARVADFGGLANGRGGGATNGDACHHAASSLPVGPAADQRFFVAATPPNYGPRPNLRAVVPSRDHGGGGRYCRRYSGRVYGGSDGSRARHSRTTLPRFGTGTRSEGPVRSANWPRTWTRTV